MPTVPFYDFDTDFVLKVRPTIRVVQSDIGREFVCHAKFNGQKWDLTGFTGTVLGVKPDGNATDTTATIDEDEFKFTLTEQMAAVAGAYEIFLTVENGSDVKIQAPVLLCVLEGADGVISESALGALTELLQASQEALEETSQYATAAAASAEDAEEAADLATAAADSILVDVTDRTPYLFRQSGGGVETGDREYDTIVGGSIAWNQLAKSDVPSSEHDGVSSVKNNDGSYTINGTATGRSSVNISSIGAQSGSLLSNHVYYCKAMPASGFTPVGSGNSVYPYVGIAGLRIDKGNGGIYKHTSSFTSTQLRVDYDTGVVFDNAVVWPQWIDLTQMFGSTIADYIYSLEQGTAGAGVAWFRQFFPADYYEYNAGELLSVSGVSAHVMRDADDNIIGNYPLDDSLTLRGIPKLDGGKLYYDGDTYESDGTVTRKYGVRAYQSGDESLADAITDGTNTVYKLTTPTTETADPFTNPQVVDPDGTEEYVTDSIVPVGHETIYRTNLLDNLNNILKAPTADGTYTMKVTVSNGEATYFWD
jgi:hypothetical protein